MSALSYMSGDEIKEGDRIRYHGEPGHVDFVVTQPSGDQARDWYLEQFPGGGLMIRAETFGSVFLTIADVDDQLELVSRAETG